MIKIGSIVRIVELKTRNPKSWLFRLQTDETKATHLGQIDHNELITKNFGDLVSSSFILSTKRAGGQQVRLEVDDVNIYRLNGYSLFQCEKFLVMSVHRCQLSVKGR